ncbi:MAG: hypothetical protein ACYCT2_09780 [Thermoplasmataceae archaeon]
MTAIEGEARRTMGFGVAEQLTFTYRTPVGPVSIQIPRIMTASEPKTIRFRIEWDEEDTVNSARD